MAVEKLKVYQWQYDDIEAAVWKLKDGRKWLDESLEVARYSYKSDLPYVYVFFGTESRMEEWRRFMGFGEYPTVRVIHALNPDKLEGLRGVPVRIYDKDGDKTWYHQNYHDPLVQQTLHNINHIQSMCGTIERLEFDD